MDAVGVFLPRKRSPELITVLAIAGIGSENVIDHGARVDLTDLEKRLEDSLKNQRAVYAVVAIIGFVLLSKFWPALADDTG